MNKIVANKGDEVEILYVGKLKDGTIFDTTEGKAPFKFIAGTDKVLEGISNGVINMKVGDKKTIELSPEKAYGQFNNELLVKIPRNKLPEKVEIGDVLTDSDQNHWWVRQIADDFAIVDGNHPLAGQTLIFDIELVKIS